MHLWYFEHIEQSYFFYLIFLSVWCAQIKKWLNNFLEVSGAEVIANTRPSSRNILTIICYVI